MACGADGFLDRLVDNAGAVGIYVRRLMGSKHVGRKSAMGRVWSFEGIRPNWLLSGLVKPLSYGSVSQKGVVALLDCGPST